MAVDRRLQLRSRHHAEPWRRALMVGAVAGVVALVLPVELLEVAIASVGLSEAVPALAPPMAWSARIGTALLIALIVAALGWSFSGLVPLLGRRKMTIAWPKSLRWDSLTRMARGIDSGALGNAGEGFDDAYSLMRPGSRPRYDMSDAMDWQPRRRVDMHPDAPPRPPIVASRDLPSPDAEPRRVPRAMPFVAPPVISAPVQDRVDDARPRPMPRSPEPLSEAQLDTIRDLLARQDRSADAAVPPAPAPDPRGSTNRSPPASMHLDVAKAAPLSSLLNRFEQQVERKIAIKDSVNVSPRADMAAPQPEGHSDLRAALERLKSLSQPARKA